LPSRAPFRFGFFEVGGTALDDQVVPAFPANQQKRSSVPEDAADYLDGWIVAMHKVDTTKRSSLCF